MVYARMRRFFAVCVALLASLRRTGARADTAPVNWSEPGVSELPTGTVTLLLADVEGSTRLWETQPEEMAAAVARLDRTLSESSPPMVVCARSSRVRATASWSRSRAPATRWRARWNCSGRRWRRSGCASACTPVRCSCATTATTSGPTINRAARLRDLAHGGQTVLSGHPTIWWSAGCRPMPG